MTLRKRMPRNFRTYGTMEAASIFLLAAVAVFFGRPQLPAEMLAMALAIAAASCFLLVGARYWLALDRRLARADRSSLQKALAFADRVEVPFLLVTVSSAVWLVFALWLHGWTSALIAAGLLTLLAGLEYVNYYHRQLQHFDQWSDFKRLVSTGRFRPSHMSRALAAYRARR